MITPLTRGFGSDVFVLLTDDVKAHDNLKYDQKMTASGQIRKLTAVG
jgi:hypothetical protein